jgi:hypothetical protein
MIINKPGSHFIFILHSDCVYRQYNYINYEGKELTNKEYLQHWGKWVFTGSREELDKLANKIDRYVERKIIPAAKYDQEIIQEFNLGECVMCIFCDARQREDVWEVLQSLGVQSKAWVFERETMERWSPGGHLLETWIKNRGLSPEEAEKMREGARLKFKKMFEHEEAIFRGINQ